MRRRRRRRKRIVIVRNKLKKRISPASVPTGCCCTRQSSAFLEHNLKEKLKKKRHGLLCVSFNGRIIQIVLKSDCDDE